MCAVTFSKAAALLCWCHKCEMPIYNHLIVTYIIKLFIHSLYFLEIHTRFKKQYWI